MPTVDFTLDDIAKQTEQIISRALAQERAHTAGLLAQERAHVDERFTQERAYMDQRFEEERAHTHSIMQKVVQDVVQDVVSTELMSFWDHNLSPVLEELLTDVKELKREVKRHGRILNQHSRDIMELRATQSSGT